MRDEITRLMGLQTIDRRLRELEESLSKVAGRVDQLREETLKNQSELERLTEEDTLAAAARKKMERELAEGEARIRNKRMRLNLVRNEKELQATTSEVESLKENNQRLESELLTAMESVDARAARIKGIGEAVKQGRAELAQAELDIAAEVEELKSAIAKTRKERDQVVSEIDPTLVQRYDMIFHRRGGVAVALAKSGTCQGCRMRIAPQLFNEIQKHRQIHFCPNCQRILYFEG
ncbi:MAG TPA: C4-type zinc ribbon domain-containing protein [Candidatus Binataceae bacterium]